MSIQQMFPEGRPAQFWGGEWRVPHGEATMEIVEPATGTVLATVADGDAADVGTAVEAAARAFPAWRDMPVLERAACVIRAADRMVAHADELALLETRNTGNPIAVMRPEMEMCATFMRFFAGLATEMKGTTIPVSADAFAMTVREPLGVVARICAFNHPALYASAKVAGPLVAGNTVVVKPSDFSPLTALRLAELWRDIFPPGVFNVVTGSREVGAALASHPRVAKISLIGSPAAGRAVMQAASVSLKKLTLELGGKNALVACADSDPAEIAEAVLRGMNLRSVTGQSCGSTSRIYLHEDIREAVVGALAERLGRMRIGLPTDPETEIGALSSRAQYEKTLHYIRLSEQQGARLVCGGRRPENPALAEGFFVAPAVFDGVTEEMALASEEVFGPVAAVLGWRDEKDLVARVNASPYGLTAAIFSRDIDRAHRLARKLEAGFVWINDSATHYLGVPFGGYKQSGFGREESIEEMLDCTQTKTIMIKTRAETAA